ncbi:MAG: HEPN domain-containing protein [Candidatus Aenigmarchaeota archaeon]|nr:HEPN domain-containing protein [Candidatus Aenigmarchaeota archaeon]
MENIKREEELLGVAERDLKATKVLYEKKLYPQAIFYFQQSVEKANKSFGLMLNIISEKDLLKISHNPTKIHVKDLCEQKKENREFNKTLENYPKLKKIKLLKNNDSKMLETNLNKSIEFWKNSIKSKKAINFSYADLKNIIIEIKNMKKMKKVIVKKEDWINIKKDINELFDVLSEYNADKDKLESERRKLNNFDFKPTKITILEPFFEFISLYYTIIFLSAVTMHHSNCTRYPVDNKIPRKLYTKKLFIVKYLPDLIKLQYDSIKGIKRYNELMKLKNK